MSGVATTSITIDRATDQFGDHLVREGYPTSTVSTYKKELRLWRQWLAGTVITESVHQLTREDLTEYLVHLAREGRGRSYARSQGAPSGLSPTTIKKKLAALKRFTRFCQEQGYHHSDLAGSIKSPRVPRKEPVFLNQQEYKTLLYEAQRRSRPRDEAILQMLIQCGLREGELVHLTLEDVDLNKREIHVRNRKGGIDTDIPLSSPVVEVLTKWLGVRPDVGHARVFVSKTGRALGERDVRYLVHYYMGRAGIRKQASAHTLRHTFGAWKSAKGVDLKTIQYWMGHKRAETTLHYLHLVKKRAPELMEATSL